ncbi:MAG: phenylalanine--tRNA ligase subunit alpha [Anaerolineaceae bacterium]|nr:phenylalanine--tRNA ligase subunit alpha [Anaerolineaceae bacterium]MDD4043521.1 phenylalanine--tRNA ligase subunit alpha [Anaerolineaceae bacterium]MDD4577323.1 phenylalanine--tRNA ligase subunit alpha [Anaerolineaceae bacterium]
MTELESQLQNEQQGALESLAQVASLEALDVWKQTYLGKSSLVMTTYGKMGTFTKEERPLIGRAVNAVKVALEAALSEKEVLVKQDALLKTMANEKLDVTLPGFPVRRGRLHPLNLTMREIYRVFGDMGFQVYNSPEVETDDMNFTFLNIPPYHPARDMWDTFYTETDGVVLRTHTSPGQIRAMREYYPNPVRVILPGTCMRYEQQDQSHEIEFMQFELLVVDKGVTFANLKGTMDDFTKRVFGADALTRFRPSHFPFTEPSAELDMSCIFCGGQGCGVCHGTGWIELGGCGMVHPRVLENGGYDPEVYSGFAAGVGIDRTTLLRYHIDDIRYLRGNDIRFLEQF